MELLIFRYLAKEVFSTLAALTLILLLIFMSNQFVLYLKSAVNGRVPMMLILKLMMLELPSFTVLLLPLGFYMAILTAYGRLYVDNEMTVLQACGYGSRQLMQHSLMMASVVTLVVLVVMVWCSPYLATGRAILLRTTGIQTLIKTMSPGRFHALPGGEQVFYAGSMNRDHTKAEQLFLARLVASGEKRHWDVLWATSASAEVDPITHEDYVILQNGTAYQGIPGQADYQTATFKQYKARLPHSRVDNIQADLRTLSSRDLMRHASTDREQAAELQWRLSMPLMVLVLTLLGVPLSRVNPRLGKYAKMLPAIFIFIIYANLLFIARDGLAHGKTPLWLGMWWVHLPFAGLGLLLMWRKESP